MATCTLCDRPAYSRGLCSAHYQRVRRGWVGEQLTGPVLPRDVEPVDCLCDQPLNVDHHGECQRCHRPVHLPGRP